MLDLLLALLGRRTCPWCSSDYQTPVRDWLANHLPARFYADLKIGKWDYNDWVFKTSRPIHRRHNVSA